MCHLEFWCVYLVVEFYVPINMCHVQQLCHGFTLFDVDITWCKSKWLWKTYLHVTARSV